MASADRWIVCPAHVVGPIHSQATAERRLAEIVKLGACMFDHAIVDKEPTP
jgi:hypothetical protein